MTRSDPVPRRSSTERGYRSTVTATLTQQNGAVAYYQAKFSAELTVTDATAVVPKGLTGGFRLAGYQFAGTRHGTGTKLIRVAANTLAVPSGKLAIGARFEITGVHHTPTSITVLTATLIGARARSH